MLCVLNYTFLCCSIDLRPLKNHCCLTSLCLDVPGEPWDLNDVELGHLVGLNTLTTLELACSRSKDTR